MVAREQLDGTGTADFIERDYAVPEALSNGKSKLRVRVEPEKGFTAGPVFGIRLYRAGTVAT